MACTAREKYIRTNRRSRSSDRGNPLDRATISKSMVIERPLNYHLGGMNESAQNLDLDLNSNSNSNSDYADSGWGYCTEEQLEEILLNNLEILYNEAISKLIALGYDEEVAVKAILRNGYCYGGMDVVTNILHNSLAYLNSGCGGNGNLKQTEPVFVVLKQLHEYSLAGMVCLLQQVKPHLSKGDAMWCLLMSDLHVSRASVMEIPVLPSPAGNGCTCAPVNNVENINNGPDCVGIVPALSRFHGGWGFGNGGTSQFPMNGFFSYASEMTLQREIECPKRFNLTPSMNTLLKRNVAMFAAGFRANSKRLQTQSQAYPSSLSTGDSSTVTVAGFEVPAEQNELSQSSKCHDVANSVLSKFRDLCLDENPDNVAEDEKDKMILSLVNQIKDLEKQVKERKEWAHQKAMQAARKLSSDLTELKMLRMERDETQRLKKGKQTLEDTTMKRLSEMEHALRKASSKVDHANTAVRQLETQNAEIRAEMEASKLCASESWANSLEASKREKKYQKRLMAWEKRKTKLQDEVAAEKQKNFEVQEQLIQVEAAKKEAEEKWRQEQKYKELAAALVKDERRLKDATDASNKRRLEALQLKIEVDFHRHKDDLQRLEQELLRFKASARFAESDQRSNNMSMGDCQGAKLEGETIAKLLHELDKLVVSSDREVSCDRECLVCKKEEISVVFLPCAHQVLCVNCSDDYGKKGKATCPCCRVPIEQRILVYGASS